MSSSLEKAIAQISDELTVDESGVGTATIRGVARLADVEHTALIRHFQGGDKSSSKLAEKLILSGFDPGDFSENGVPDLAIAEILEYYGYEAGQRCKEQAKLACKAFRAIGVRAWMQKLKGWEPPASNDDQMLLLLKNAVQTRERQLALERQQQEHDRRLTTLEQDREAARQELLALPPASSPIPEEAIDAKIRRIVNAYSAERSIPQSDVFKTLYTQFYYRYHRRVVPEDKESKIQAFVRLGLIDSLYDLAQSLFVGVQP